MPHATLPSTGFQAVILCGPGVSLDTFTSDPVEFPKAIVPIANRPMVWYPLDWCYRMGVNDIFLVTPPESKPALEAALAQNPHLTSLPSPRPTILAPAELTNTSGTGEIFRLKEVRDVITSDFIVLPCDLVCELEGLSLLQEWMVQQAGFGGATGGIDEDTGRPIAQGSGGENIGRRGGLGVWYDTKGEGTLVVKGEQTDFIATVAVPDAIIPPRKGSIRSNISKVVMSIPTDTLKDMMEEQGSFKVRHSLLKKFGRIKMKTTMRDAHIYLLPFWVLDLMKNEKLDSVGEDVLGWWAKATWQDGLGEKLGLRDVLDPPAKHLQGDLANSTVNILDEEISVESYSSTRRIATPATSSESQTQFASRVQGSNPPKPVSHLVVPPILAYSHPSDATAPIIRRVDTTALLLAISVQLAALPATTGLPKGTKSSPLAHPLKIAHPDSIPRQTRIEKDNCLLAENVTVGEKCNIKETVIGAGCEIGVGARLLKCVLMEGVIIGENVSLSGCVLGRRCKIEGGPRKGDEKTDLRECEVQGGFVVPWGTDAKNEKFMISNFEGLDDGENSEGTDAPSTEAFGEASI